MIKRKPRIKRKSLSKRLLISLIISLCFLVSNINKAGSSVFEESQEPVISFHQAKVNQKELKCLAKNLFFEGHGTDFNEMIRLANVVKNRVDSDIYPETPCKVISQYKQFSWTLDPNNSMNRIMRLIKKNKKEEEAWKMAKYVAMLSLSDQLPDMTNKAIAYHSVDMEKPKSSFWRKMKNVLTSNYHIYYTENNTKTQQRRES